MSTQSKKAAVANALQLRADINTICVALEDNQPLPQDTINRLDQTSSWETLSDNTYRQLFKTQALNSDGSPDLTLLQRYLDANKDKQLYPFLDEFAYYALPDDLLECYQNHTYTDEHITSNDDIENYIHDTSRFIIDQIHTMPDSDAQMTALFAESIILSKLISKGIAEPSNETRRHATLTTINELANTSLPDADTLEKANVYFDIVTDIKSITPHEWQTLESTSKKDYDALSAIRKSVFTTFYLTKQDGYTEYVKEKANANKNHEIEDSISKAESIASNKPCITTCDSKTFPETLESMKILLPKDTYQKVSNTIAEIAQLKQHLNNLNEQLADAKQIIDDIPKYDDTQLNDAIDQYKTKYDIDLGF